MKLKHKLVLALKIAVSASLLVIILLKVDWNEFVMPDHKGRISYLWLGLVLGVVFNLLKFLKWQQLIRTANAGHTYRDAAKSYMIGNSLGLVTPLRVGDLGRAIYFVKGERTKIMALTVIDRIMDLSAVLLLSVNGIFILIHRGAALCVGLAAILSVLFFYFNKHLVQSLRKALRKGNSWEKIAGWMDALHDMGVRTISSSLTLSLCAFVVVILQFFYLISSFEPAGIRSIYLVTPLITLSSIMPVTFMGLGVREGTSVLLLANFGISGATAVAAALLMFIINNVIVAIIGIIFIWKTV